MNIKQTITDIINGIDLPGEEMLDKGISEYEGFYSKELDVDITIGVSYESDAEFDDGHVDKGYIVNLFAGDPYIDVPGTYTKDTMDVAIDKLVEAYKELIREK